MGYSSLNMGADMWSRLVYMKRYARLLYILAFTTLVFGTMYGLVQQQNRQQANDMSAIVANETAAHVEANPKLTGIDLNPINLRTSRAPFIDVYNKKGELVAGSGLLDGKIARLPVGVVEHAQSGKPHTVTWAPDKDVRIATVIVATNNYYVVGGQSLKSAESRMDSLTLLWAIGYGIAVVLAVGSFVVHSIICKRCGCGTGEKPCAKHDRPDEKPAKE